MANNPVVVINFDVIQSVHHPTRMFRASTATMPLVPALKRLKMLGTTNDFRNQYDHDDNLQLEIRQQEDANREELYTDIDEILGRFRTVGKKLCPSERFWAWLLAEVRESAAFEQFVSRRLYRSHGSFFAFMHALEGVVLKRCYHRANVVPGARTHIPDPIRKLFRAVSISEIVERELTRSQHLNRT